MAQELEDTELSYPGQDSPDYGCRYEVYYNQVQLGMLQISADSLNYTTDNPLVYVRLDLDQIRMLPFGHIQAFMQRLMSEFIIPEPGYDYPRAPEMINSALLELLWPYTNPEYEEDPDMDRSLDFRYSGLARWVEIKSGKAR